MGKKPKNKPVATGRATGNKSSTGGEPSRRHSRQTSKQKDQLWQGELAASLAKLGLRIKTVAADGNCFFRACSDQLQGNEGLHLDLRGKVLDFMEEHSEDFAPYMEDDETFESYCKRMRKDGAWAGMHEQVATARLHGLELRIYQAGQPCWTIHPEYPEIPKAAPAWHLSYHDGEHYNSVRLADDFGSGPPTRIPVLDGKVAAPAELVAAASASERRQIQEVVLGTGCEDEAAVRAALRAADGSSEQAIEFLIERLAEEPSEEPPASVALENPDPGARQPPTDLGTSHSPRTAACREPQAENGDVDGVMAAEPTLRGNPLGSPAVNKATLGTPETGTAPADREDTSTPPVADARRIDEHLDSKQPQRTSGRVQREKRPARNRACVCGSGRKYKDCCGAAAKAAAARRSAPGQANGVGTDLRTQLDSLYI